MTRWGLFLAGYAVGLMLFRLIWRTLSARTENTERSTTPSIPSAMDDWDEEFKRLTGVSPFPELVVRTGATEVTTHRIRDYEHQPGDVSYHRYPRGYIVLDGTGTKEMVFKDCYFEGNS